MLKHTVACCTFTSVHRINFPKYWNKSAVICYYFTPSVVLPSVLWHCWLGVRKSMQPVKTVWWGAGVFICLEQGANDLHMVQLMPLPPHRIFASLKPRLVKPFWCRLTKVVLEKRPLNGCLTSAKKQTNWSRSYSLLVGINKSQSKAVSFNKIQLTAYLIKEDLTLRVLL